MYEDFLPASAAGTFRSNMRPATNTVNYSDALPLAQGVEFEAP